MGGRGSALWWGAILLVMVSAPAWLTGCMADVNQAPEEHTGRAESALNDLSDDTDPPDPGDKGDPGDNSDPGHPGDAHKDPEPQPWAPDPTGAMNAGAPVAPHGQGAKDDDGEAAPWSPRTSGDGQETTSTTSSTKQH